MDNEKACEACAAARDDAEDRATALEKERDELKALLEEAHQSIESDHREQEIRRVHVKLDALRVENKQLRKIEKAAWDALRAFDKYVHVDHVPKSVWDLLKRWYNVRANSIMVKCGGDGCDGCPGCLKNTSSSADIVNMASKSDDHVHEVGSCHNCPYDK